MRQAIELNSTDTRFWNAVMVAFEKKVPFTVRHEGSVWQWLSFPGDSLVLVSAPDAKGLKHTAEIQAPDWVVDQVFA